MDEIQDVPAWELFVNRLLRNQMHLLLTGSNSKLLSSELATHLAGRHIPIGKKLNCKDLLLVTDHENGEEKQDGMTVRIVDVTTWLLEAPKEEPPKWGEPPVE